MAGTDAQSLDRRVFHAQQACCFRRGVVYRLEIRRLGHQVGIPDDIVAAGTAVIVVTCRQLHVQSLQAWPGVGLAERSEEHTSELQSLMRISYDVFCLKKTNNHN